MSQGVHTNELRFEFVKGWLTGGTDPGGGAVECGPGTAYPMLVTLDQLAEIMYRVRDCSATGSLTLEQRKAEIDVDGETFLGWQSSGVSNFHTYTFFNDLSENLCEREGTYDFFCATDRGYFARAESIPAFTSPFFGTGYSVTDLATFDPTLMEVREAISELAMWTPTDPLGFKWGVDQALLYWPGDNLFSCGFTFASGSNFYYGGFPTYPAFHCFAILVDSYFDGVRTDGYVGSDMRLSFSGLVAYVGADSPTDPAAQLYVGLDFKAGYVLSSIGGAGYTSVCNLILELAASLVSCPLYVADQYVDYGEDIEDEYIFSSATDFVFTATQWWPYAKDSPAVPVWDTDTGALL